MGLVVLTIAIAMLALVLACRGCSVVLRRLRAAAVARYRLEHARQGVRH